MVPVVGAFPRTLANDDARVVPTGEAGVGSVYDKVREAFAVVPSGNSSILLLLLTQSLVSMLVREGLTLDRFALMFAMSVLSWFRALTKPANPKKNVLASFETLPLTMVFVMDAMLH